MTAHDDKFEQVCKPFFEAQNAALSMQITGVADGVEKMGEAVGRLYRVLEGTNGDTGLRMKVDRLHERELVRSARDIELTAMRGRIVSSVLVAILLALGSAVVSAAVQFKTYEMVRTVNEQGKIAPVIVTAPQPSGGKP
jgi:hypothetical protein